MHISLNWLNEYIKIDDLSPTEIADALTSVGLEVESISKPEPLDSKIIVAKIEGTEKHPQADRLQVCQVNAGGDEPLTVVCGAPNARVGLFVALAQNGSILPDGTKLKPGKIRGVKSEGMLCSEQELNLSESHDGILELDESVTLGTPIQEILGNNDVVMELGITPNRGDCFGYIGIARDLGAKLGREVTIPSFSAPIKQGLNTSSKIKLDVQENSGCSRFYALYVEGVASIQSPRWMQQRLENSGVRAINLIVDATNYTMLETGQPIHAYDYRDLSGETLGVRTATAGETLTTLDEQVRELQDGDILICDKDKPVGLAGVMGGANSEVKEDTLAIVVESAFFDPIAVRKTSKRLGIHTDASHRFERTVDINNIAVAGQRVADLIYSATQELISSGERGLSLPEIAESGIDYFPNPSDAKIIALRLDRLHRVLGVPTITKNQCEKILSSLEIRMVDSKDKRMVFEIPSWRNDITKEIDLIEEVARIYGLENISYDLPKMNLTPNHEDPFLDFCENARYSLGQLNLSETITFPFQEQGFYKKLLIDESHSQWPTIVVKNPISEEANVLQTTLLPSLLEGVLTNRFHGVSGCRLFEIGRSYFSHDIAQTSSCERYFSNIRKSGRHVLEHARSGQSRPIERLLLGGVLDTPFLEKSWISAEIKSSFYHGKAIIESCLKALNLPEAKFSPAQAGDFPFLHPKKSADILINGAYVGYIGELHPEVAINLDIALDAAPVLFECDLEALFDCKLAKTVTIDSQIQKFPGVSRDFAFVVESKITHEAVDSCLNAFKQRKHLKAWQLFDVYQGQHIEDGKKSFAFRFNFESTSKTLTDKEVDKEASKIMEWLKSEVNAEMR